MIGQQQDHVGRQRLVEADQRRPSAGREAGGQVIDVRLDHQKPSGAGFLQPLDHGDRRTLAQVAHVGLVGEAKAGDHRGLDALAGGQHLLRHPQRLAAGA